MSIDLELPASEKRVLGASEVAPVPVPLVRKAEQILKSDTSRVITRLYLPGQEIVDDGISRADSVIERIMEMTDEEVTTTLAETIGRFAGRHLDLRTDLAENFALVAHRLPRATDISKERSELIGAYFTKEYALEGAALFNPSIVPHMDQTGLEPGELR